MVKIKGVFIYSDHPSKALSIKNVIGYLTGCGLPVIDRGNFFESLDLNEDELLKLARKVAGIIVPDMSNPLDEIQEPSYGEIDAELKRIKGSKSYLGVGAVHELPPLYDGLWLQRVLYGIMSQKIQNEFGSGFIHIIFTSRLFGTFETKRYHARVVLTGIPSLISTSGVVEAPARPKEYYWLKAGLIQSGKDIRELDLMYKGKLVEYDDPRLSQVLRSYALQPIFYEITGNPFCDDPSCCLYNSHWQEEVLKTQLEGKLCEEHEDVILKFGREKG